MSTTGPCCFVNQASNRHSRIRRALRRLLSFVTPDKVAQRIFPGTPPIVIDGPSGSKATHHLDISDVSSVHRVRSCDSRTSYVPCLQLPLTLWAGRVTIDILPDNVLLYIFHFDSDRVYLPWNWYRLLHVCKRWRSVVFASPNYLDLKLVCGPRTRVELAGIWPPLPIIVRNMVECPMPEDYDLGAAIVHHNRVREIELHHLSNSQLLRVASAMQGPFPALIHLMLDSSSVYHRPDPDPAPTLLDGFSAPHVQSLTLQYIPFPALPKLLLSATDLVDLTLVGIPQTGYFTPVALVTGLTVSVNLKSLTIEFKSSLSRLDRESRRPPPTTRSVLPALTCFSFRGVNEYLEDVVAQIDAPLLNSIRITFFNQLIFDIRQLAQFMGRATKFQAFNEVYVGFYSLCVRIESPSWTRSSDEGFELTISCTGLDWQLSSLAQVLTSFFPFSYMVEHLYINGPRTLPSRWLVDVENAQWLEVFYPFTALKNLYVCNGFGQCIAFALQELVVERVTEVFPALETLFLREFQPSGPVQVAIGRFVTARKTLGHPVAVSHWNRR
jgi:F-box-like